MELHGYDGGLMPRRPDDLPVDVELPRDGGVLYVGERAVLLHRTYGRIPQLFPEGLMDEAETVPHTMARVPDEGHEMNWVRACKGEDTAVSPFSYAAPLTETMLLGLVALRAGQGQRIYWDGAAGRITNHDEAHAYLSREYRPGWGMP